MTTTSKPLIGLGLVLAAAAAAVAFWIWQRPRAEQDRPMAAPPTVLAASDELRFAAGAPQLSMLRVATLAAVPVPLAEPLEARLAYDEDATVRLSVPVAGRVVALHAQAGDAVKAGQPLLDFDAPELGSAVAELDRARVEERQHGRSVARLRELAPGDAIPARELEQAEAELAAAQAERVRAEQRLSNLNPWKQPLQGQRLSLRSPLTGVVTERNANPAAELAPGGAAPVFVVSQLDRLWVMVDLPERLLGQVRVGDVLNIESDTRPGRRLAARVAQIGRAVDPNSRRVPVRATLDNREAGLLPEMFVRAWLEGRDGARAVRVPNSALVHRGLYAYVFVESAPGRFVRRAVEFAARGGEASFVSKGVADGERVVTRGAMLLDAELASPSDARP